MIKNGIIPRLIADEAEHDSNIEIPQQTLVYKMYGV